jgi:ubiquinone/menaquinone biosynthesis C-methylase UbiE
MSAGPDRPQKTEHPLFARLWMLIGDRALSASQRAELLRGVAGEVVEVGAGSGLNFPHYTDAVSHVTAVEPEPTLRRLARVKADAVCTRIDVIDAVAAALPIPDGSCDVAFVSLVLCSVPDQAAALAELHRVLRPGGELRFCEHVAAAGAVRSRLQRVLDRSGVWPSLAAGCHLSRDTVASIQRAGFMMGPWRAYESGLGPLRWPHVIGVAYSGPAKDRSDNVPHRFSPREG